MTRRSATDNSILTKNKKSRKLGKDKTLQKTALLFVKTKKSVIQLREKPDSIMNLSKNKTQS